MRQKKTERPAFVKRDSIVAGKEYAQLLGVLKERFRKSQIKAAVKVNTVMLEYYWDMGRDISRLHAAAKWGSAFFDCLSLDLKTEFPGQTGFSVTNIKYAKRWYEFYNQEDIIRQRVVDEFRQEDFEIVSKLLTIFVTNLVTNLRCQLDLVNDKR